MNPKLVSFISSNSPKIDTRIGEGIAYTESKKVLGFLDKLINMHTRVFPKGLVYHGIRLATPREEFLFRINGKNYQREPGTGTSKFKLIKEDVRLAIIHFEYKGESIEKPLYIPFVRRHGIMYINGSKYVFTPVLADGTITAKHDCVFTKFLKIKLFFKRREFSFFEDGVLKHVGVVYSNVHNKRNEEAKTQPILFMSTLANYLMAKYGMSGMLAKFGIHKYKMLEVAEYQEYVDQYPESEWVTITSTNKKPNGSYKYNYYHPTQFMLLVNREEYTNCPIGPEIMGSILFTMDHYTLKSRINPDNINDVNTWQDIIGESIHSSNESYTVIRDGMVKHMASLDGYVDTLVREDLAKIGVHNIENIFDFFEYILLNFKPLTENAYNRDLSGSSYGKQIQVLPFLLYNIIYTINSSVYFPMLTISTEEARDPNRETTIQEIRKNLDKIKPNAFHGLLKWYAGLMILDDPTDNNLYKMGRTITLQERSDKIRTRNSATDINAPDSLLDASLLETGATYDMTKRNPTGRNRLNVFITIDENGVILRNPELKQIIDSVAEDIKSV